VPDHRRADVGVVHRPTVAEVQQRFGWNSPFSPADRAWLHQRINLRFAQMLEQGLVDELRELRSAIHSIPACPPCAASAIARPGASSMAKSTPPPCTNKAPPPPASWPNGN
jgi:hypothetical protein